MKTNEFKADHEAQATAWKQRTRTLPDAAREPAAYITKDGRPVGDYPFCLPPAFAGHNLLPDVRDGALMLFGELGIPWHASVEGGPSNHLLSSQVQCVNALYPMVDEPSRIQDAFGHLVDIDEVLEIEPGRYLTFEYIGPTDYFGEGRGSARTRGSHCTSVDAAFRYRTSSGIVEIALVEWKYTESYPRAKKPPAGYNAIRTKRYSADYAAPEGPITSDVIDLELLFDEPLYQLLRQQLLAHRLETDPAVDADVVRVLHVLDPANGAYQRSLVRPETRALGADVDTVWSALLRRPDRFAHVDPAVFLDADVTSAEYADRYRRQYPRA